MSSVCSPTALGWISANPSPPWNVGQTINFKITLSLQSNNSNYECDVTSATATLYVNGNASGSTNMTPYTSTATGTVSYTIPSSYSSSSLTAYGIINYQYTVVHRATHMYTGGGTGGVTIPKPIYTQPSRTVYNRTTSYPVSTNIANTQPTSTTVKTVVRTTGSIFLQPNYRRTTFY